MEKPIFDFLVEISSKECVDFKDVSGVSNRDQRIYEHEKFRKLNYLEENGFVSKTKDIYTATEYGYMVAQYKSWTEYLQHQKELLNRKIAKEKNDLKISEFQVRTTYFPYLLSIISIVLSFIALFYPFKSKDKDNQDIYGTVYKKTETQVKSKKPNTILTKRAVDSAKWKIYLGHL